MIPTEKQKARKLSDRCVLCGGEGLSETGDHVPSQDIFENRVAPEGFLVPACRACNHATHILDLRTSALSWMQRTPDDSANSEHFSPRIAGMMNNDHQLVGEVIALFRLPEGGGGIQFKSKFYADCHTLFEKWVRGWFFLETGRIVPRVAEIRITIQGNASWSDARVEASFSSLEGKMHRWPVRRGKIDLSNQFELHSVVRGDSDFGAYYFRIRDFVKVFATVVARTRVINRREALLANLSQRAVVEAIAPHRGIVGG